ncbi:MAG TPA: type II toxin-antitoxin system prevent-host-death family antitoxin [Thermoanaerobaculia bacterium]|jgi:prevent-host-death family protein|nr:type II toxin-antitoxin system prevent-host-death family antitoxin [Thermoanaerobaculia bacterium]HEV8610300.1 type II toxin-antitoxin system prevent-host-death family antitoxin [Thermoanaerobaculia bacterium]
MTRVGVKALKDRLSEYLRRVGNGERVVVTDRGKPIAAITPIEEPQEVRLAWDLVRRGLASWSGGKPRGSARPPALKGGKTAAEIVLEDRR